MKTIKRIMLLIIGVPIVAAIALSIFSERPELTDEQKQEIHARIEVKQQLQKPVLEIKEGHIYWDEYTEAYKTLIIEGLHKVYAENDRCMKIDLDTVGRSTSKGTPDNPVFFVMCQNEKGKVFNVFFSKSDIEQNRTLQAVSNPSKNQAIQMCKEWIQSQRSYLLHVYAFPTINPCLGRKTMWTITLKNIKKL